MKTGAIPKNQQGYPPASSFSEVCEPNTVPLLDFYANRPDIAQTIEDELQEIQDPLKQLSNLTLIKRTVYKSLGLIN